MFLRIRYSVVRRVCESTNPRPTSANRAGPPRRRHGIGLIIGATPGLLFLSHVVFCGDLAPRRCSGAGLGLPIAGAMELVRDKGRRRSADHFAEAGLRSFPSRTHDEDRSTGV